MSENTPPALPHPTKTRLQLARDIQAGSVRRYHFINPWTCRTYDDRNVTARTDELIRAGLAAYAPASERDQSFHTNVRLTPAGEEWLAQHGSSE